MFSKDIRDRAHEWVTTNYPDLSEPDYDHLMWETCNELVVLDAAADTKVSL